MRLFISYVNENRTQQADHGVRLRHSLASGQMIENLSRDFVTEQKRLQKANTFMHFRRFTVLCSHKGNPINVFTVLCLFPETSELKRMSKIRFVIEKETQQERIHFSTMGHRCAQKRTTVIQYMYSKYSATFHFWK